MGKSVIKAFVVALALLLMPSLAIAAGLGKLTVLSGLGQPLKAEIELVSVQKGEAGNLGVRLPPSEVFRQANIDYSGALLSIKFSIEQRGVDRYVILISSSQPMNEPFLDLLVELNWAGGRLVREYTFLLDPVEYKGPEQAPALAAPAPAAAPVVKQVEPPKQPEAGASDRPAAAPAALPKAARSYEVKRGDTLSKIAIANKVDGVSLQQMLIALYRSNPDAFVGNNINRMRAGKILNIPDRDTAASVDQSDATRAVIAQAAEFNEYRRKLGAAVAAAPERPDARRQSASGKITAKVEDKPATVKDSKDQLRLSKADEPGKPGAKPSAQGRQEDSLAKEKALKESNERIALLDKNAQDMKKLLELKSQAGAQLQQQAAKAAADKAAEPAKAQEAAKADAPAPEAAKQAAEPAKQAPEAPAKAVEAAKAVEPAKTEPAKAAPKAGPAASAPPEPSLMDEILNNDLALYGGGGCLLLLFGGYGYYAWTRKKAQQKIENSTLGELGGPSVAENAVFGDAGGARVDTGASEAQGEIGKGGAAAAIDTEEVDPIAEADVYMAYGRDTQAEEILKEALAKDPSRQPVRVKLLEIYAGRKDVKKFETVAAELHASTGGEGEEWAKVVALGLQLDPSNPLYGGTASAGSFAAHGDTHVLSTADLAAVTVVVPEVALSSGEKPAPAAGMDFDLDLGGDQGKPAHAGREIDGDATVAAGSSALGGVDTAATSIDFNFELPGEGGAQTAAQAPKEGGGDIDFDFNLELPATTEQTAAAPLDLSSISLDLGASGGTSSQPDAHWQEVATKLDLAKAYQEMGDKDGARELLNEVLKEGDAAQKQQAQTMFSALG